MSDEICLGGTGFVGFIAAACRWRSCGDIVRLRGLAA
jgi:hypothetical protein